MEYSLRDQLLGLDKSFYSLGGVAKFRGLNISVLEKLFEKKYINLDFKQNFSPAMDEFYDFMFNHPGVTAFGYVVSSERNDTRVSIEGIEYYGEEIDKYEDDFIYFAGNANDIRVKNGLYAWWN